MKRILSLAVLALVLATGVALAQQGPAQPGSAGQQMPMQGGMCPMMGGMMHGGGMMGGGMMGMMGGQSDSPRMMQMRAEMMRAMADIMTKYAKMMEGGSR
jgi:hypothetical protein